LIGAPPGYVGYDQGGILVDAIRRTPYGAAARRDREGAPDLLTSSCRSWITRPD
jgi:ATP-dependent Clp protease ATP-binding subunit ClpA